MYQFSHCSFIIMGNKMPCGINIHKAACLLQRISSNYRYLNKLIIVRNIQLLLFIFINIWSNLIRKFHFYWMFVVSYGQMSLFLKFGLQNIYFLLSRGRKENRLNYSQSLLFQTETILVKFKSMKLALSNYSNTWQTRFLKHYTELQLAKQLYMLATSPAMIVYFLHVFFL